MGGAGVTAWATLACGHELCTPCLVRLARSSHECPPCPFCRAPILSPGEGDSRGNSYLANLRLFSEMMESFARRLLESYVDPSVARWTPEATHGSPSVPRPRTMMYHFGLAMASDGSGWREPTDEEFQHMVRASGMDPARLKRIREHRRAAMLRVTPGITPEDTRERKIEYWARIEREVGNAVRNAEVEAERERRNHERQVRRAHAIAERDRRNRERERREHLAQVERTTRAYESATGSKTWRGSLPFL